MRITETTMKTWKDLKLCNVIAKRRDLEKKIRLRQNDYADYLERCGRHEMSDKIRNWDISTESEYYDTLFEIDCHFGLHLINDIFALKTVEKELLIELDKKRVEELFENELKVE